MSRLEQDETVHGGSSTSDADATLTLDTVIGARYRVVSLIARGAMGEVYRVEDLSLGLAVALKIMFAEDRADEQLRERFRREIQLARMVTHPNVCRIFDAGEHDQRPFLTMELLAGESLKDRLDRDGPMTSAAAWPIVEQLCQGLHAAHLAGVVHRDLKCANVIVDQERVVIADFGVARLDRPSDMTLTTAGVVVGTPAYMAPEQALGGDVTGSADIYALGVVMYEMLTGARPYDASSATQLAARQAQQPPVPPSHRRAEVDPIWEAVILRCLERQPQDRFGSALEVAEALATRRVRGRASRRLAIVATIGVGLLGAIVAIGAVRARRDVARGWRPQIAQLPAFEENADVPDVSPDGSWIAYQSDREEHGHWRVYVESLVDGTVHAVSPPGMPARAPRFTADGAALLVTSYDRPYQGAFLLPLAGGEPQLVDPLARAATPCGDGILLVRIGPYRAILREKGARERELASLGEDQIRWPSCDREGKRAVFTRLIGRPGVGLQDASDLWLVTMDGDLRRLTDDGLENDTATFHPDGRSVVFSSHRSGKYQLWELALRGGAAEQLTFDDEPKIGVVVTPDGQRLLYDVDDTTMQVVAYRTSGQGGPHKVTAKLEDILSVDIAPDGLELVVTAQQDVARRVAILPVDGTHERILAQGDLPIFGNDGREVFFVDGDDPRRVLAVPRAGGAPREVTRVAGEVIALASGSDGRIHLTVKGAGAWSVPESGGEATLEASEPWTLIRPAPVGGWRIAVQPSAYRLLAPGKALDDPGAVEFHAREVAWDRDGRSVVWFEGNDLVRYSLDSGERVKVFEADEGGAFAMSPEQRVAYVLTLAGHVHRALIVNYGERPRPAAP